MVKKRSKNKSKKTENKTPSILAHILGIFIYIIGPLIILLATKEKQVKKHAKNALNWQISLIIYHIVIFVVFVSSISASSILTKGVVPNIFIFFLFILAISVLGILNFVFCIIAAIQASEDVLWKYPLTITFIK